MGYHGISAEQSAPEDQELVLDHMLEQILNSKAAIKVNEGNKGIILELDTTNLPNEANDYFLVDLADDGEEDETIAVKLLKIYAGTEGRDEYDLQKKARRVLKAEKIKGVRVPKPRNFRELTIQNDEVIKHLESMGIKIGLDGIVEIISMDFVPGRDLATIMYEAYVRNHKADFQKAYPDLELEDYLKQININDLINLVHRLAGVKNKYSNFDDSPEAAQERNEIDKIISQNVIHQGLITKDQAQALLSAVNALHKHGIYHRDLHPRNIMITDDGEMEIIDFGSATEINPNDKLDLKSVYRFKGEPDRHYHHDDEIVTLAGKLAITETDIEQKSMKDIVDLISRLSANKPKIWADFISVIPEGDDLNKLIDVYAPLFGSDLDRNVKIALLLEISNHGRQEEVRKYLRGLIEAESTKRKHSRSDFWIQRYKSLLDFLS